MYQYFLPALWSFLACVGFTLLFNIRGWGIPITCAGGALGWLIYLLFGKTIPAALLASAFIGVYAEIAARLRRCPVTGYVLVALLPLVPGGGIYYAMRQMLSQDMDQARITLLETFGMATALAIGSMLSSSVFRASWSYVKRLHAQVHLHERHHHS